jgi:hypothetical protein
MYSDTITSKIKTEKLLSALYSLITAKRTYLPVFSNIITTQSSIAGLLTITLEYLKSLAHLVLANSNLSKRLQK